VAQFTGRPGISFAASDTVRAVSLSKSIICFPSLQTFEIKKGSSAEFVGKIGKKNKEEAD